MLSLPLLVSALATTAFAKLTGDFAVTINGQVFNPPGTDSIKIQDGRALSGLVLFRGVNVKFDFRISDLAILDYSLTGAVDDLRLVTPPGKTIFTSWAPTSLTPAQLANPTLDRFEIREETVVLIVNIAGGSFKIQAKDHAQGGVLQTEPEFASTVNFTRFLAPDLFYFINPFTNKTNYGDGIDAVPKSASPTAFHNMLIAKDSPEAATLTFQSGNSTRWVIQSGGRMGAVFGEDAVEQGGVGSQCTSQCQNQNQIHGSLPVPPDPTNPEPIPGRR